MSEEEQKEELKGIPLAPIVRIMKDEAKKRSGIEYNISKEAKFFMLELIESFIRETVKEMIEGGFLKDRKTIYSEHIVRALRIPQDIVLMRNETLLKCLKRVREKMERIELKSNK